MQASEKETIYGNDSDLEDKTLDPYAYIYILYSMHILGKAFFNMHDSDDQEKWMMDNSHHHKLLRSNMTTWPHADVVLENGG